MSPMRSAKALTAALFAVLACSIGTAGAIVDVMPPGDSIGPTDAAENPTSPVVVVDWEMPKRFDTNVSDPQRYGFDPARARAYANPTSWTVTVTTCGSWSRAGGTVTSSWRLLDAAGREVTRSTTCKKTVTVPSLGTYTVEGTVRAVDGTKTAKRAITVQDHLIVVAGDSMASGEGNPDVPGNLGVDLCTGASNEIGIPISCVWDLIDIYRNGLTGAQGGTPATWKLDRDCHRSYKSGLSRAAQQIEDRDKHSSVTYLNVSCSGATVDEMIDESSDGQYGPGTGWDTGVKAPQSEQIARLLCGAAICPSTAREIKALFVSIGVNDLGLADVMTKCLLPDPLFTPDCEDMTRDDVEDAIEGLDWPSGEYAALEAELRNHRGLRIASMYQAKYPTGLFSPQQHGCGLFTFVGSSEVAYLDEMNDRLNIAVRNPVYRDIFTDPWYGHGYCAGSSRWYVTLLEALTQHMGQGEAAHKGTMHPNAAGHAQLQREFVNEFDQRNRPVTDTVDVTFEQVQVKQARTATSGRLTFGLSRVGTDGNARYGRIDGLAVPDQIDTTDGLVHDLGDKRVTVRLGLNQIEKLQVRAIGAFILPPDEVDCPSEYDDVVVAAAVNDGGGGGGSGQRCLEANTVSFRASTTHDFQSGFGLGPHTIEDQLKNFRVTYTVRRACNVCIPNGPAPNIEPSSNH